MSSSPANCPTALAVTSVSDYDGLPGGLSTPANETDLDDTFTDFSNWGSDETAARTIAGPGEAITGVFYIPEASAYLYLYQCLRVAVCLHRGTGSYGT